MSVFAVRVKVGHEAIVSKVLEQQIKRFKFDMIEGISVLLRPTNKFKDGENEKKIKSLLPGYIFVKIKDKYQKIPAKVYHFIKENAKVIDILQHSVNEAEYVRLFSSKTEPEIIASVPLDDGDEKCPAKQMVDQITEVISKSHDAFIMRCKAFIRKKRAFFQFPFYFFNKARERLENEIGPQSYETLTTGSFIVPRILQVLKSEVRVE